MNDSRKVLIKPEVLSRLRDISLRANAASQASYQRLQNQLAVMRSRHLMARMNGNSVTTCRSGAKLFTAISDAVDTLTVRIRHELGLLCQVALTNGILTADAYGKLAGAFGPQASSQPGVLDLRQQRLLRLPVNEALRVITTGLEEMCNQIDNLLAFLEGQNGEPIGAGHIAFDCIRQTESLGRP